MRLFFAFFLILHASSGIALSNNAACLLSGRVFDAESKEPLAGTNIHIKSSSLGTTTNRTGDYKLSLTPGRFVVVFSFIGYATDSLYVTAGPHDQNIQWDIYLQRDIIDARQVTVTASRDKPAVSRFKIDAPAIKNMTSPTPDVLQTVKTLPGVTGLNDASSFYNVRGGNYDENLIYINGFEIYQPHTVLKGVAENPSPVNPLMVRNINLHTGMFPVYYGDKLSSVLDISYSDGAQDKVRAALDVSTIGINAAVKGRVRRFVWGLAVRKINYGYLFSGLQTKGRYVPDFFDIQATLDYSPSSRFKLSLLTILADSRYEVKPDERSTWRGTAARYRYIFNGYEKFGYKSGLWAVRASYNISQSLGWVWNNAFNRQNETGQTELDQIVLYSASPWVEPRPDKHNGRWDRSERVENRFYGSFYHSKMFVTWTPRSGLELVLGGDVKHFQLEDDLFARTVDVTSGGLSLDVTPDFYDTKNHITGYLLGQFVHADCDILERVTLTGGIRSAWSGLNRETLLLPRLQIAWRPNDRSLFVAAAGRFAQPPVYKEMQFWQHDQPPLRAQTANQFLTGWRYRIKDNLEIKTEVFYKKLDNLISFDLDDVRIVYSGKNDARGYAYGMDLLLRGEFLPNTENWISYSYLIAREDIVNDGIGYVPRPSDRRHMLAVFMEDRMPKLPNSKLHVRFVYGAGFPFTHQKWIYDADNNTYKLEFSQRNAVTLPDYKRVDVGFTQYFSLAMFNVVIREQVLNVFNNFNTLDYDASLRGIIPHRMGGRVFNIGLRVEF